MPAAALAPDGRIVVFGGSDGGPTASNTTQIYNPTTDTWSPGRTMPISRDAAQAQTLTAGALAGDIAVFGGAQQVCFFNTTCAVTDTMDAYNPSTDTWSSLAPMHTPRYRFASVALGGKIYAIGGWTGSGNTASMEVYDPTQNPSQGGTWTTLAPFTATAGYGLEGLAAAGPDGRIYVAGGLTGPPDDSGGHPVNTVYIYTPGTNTRVQGPSLPVQAEGLSATQFSATLGPGGKVYALGGFANIPGDYALQTGTLGLVVAYDARSGRWQRLTSLPYAADGTAVVSTANGQLFVIGGAAAGSLSRVQIGTVTEALGGGQGWHPHQSVTVSDGLSADVDLADGHVDVHASGLSLPARGPDLTVGQTWDSQAAARGDQTAAGQGWSSDLTPSMGGVVTQTVSYTDSSGTRWLFPYYGSLTATSPYTAYSAPPGQSWALTTTASLTGTTGYVLADFLTGETWQFDGQGRLTSDTDAYSNTNQLAYGPSGPTSETNYNSADNTPAVGSRRSLAFSYNGSGLLADAQSPLWQAGGANQAGSQHVTYGYNSANQLTTLTRGAGTADALTTTFGYSGTQLISVTTPFTGYRQTWMLGYDPQGRVTSVTSPVSGSLGQAGYTPAYTTGITYGMSQTVVTQGYGTTGAETTTYTLDAPGEATATQDGDGHTRTTSYDTDHDPLSTTDANGNVTSDAYLYAGTTGSVGLITQTVKPALISYLAPDNASNPVVTTNFYDPRTFDLTGTVDGNGGYTLYGYDGHHAVITTTQEIGPITVGTNCSGASPAGGIGPNLVCQVNYTWRAAVNVIDRYGEITGTVDGRGTYVPNTPDYNPTAQLETGQGIGTLPYTAYLRTTAYNPQGDAVSASTPPITTTLNGITRFGPVTTTDGYDLDGNQTSVTSANGNTTTTAYDHLGRAVQTTLPPVAIMTDPGPATLGYSTVGATEDSGDFNDMTASRVVMGSQARHVVTLSAYVGAIDPTPANDRYQVAIYTDDSGSPGALVASSATGQLVGHAWNTLPISADLAANTAYWLVYNTNGSDPSYNNLVYDTAGSNVGAYASQSFGTWPASFGSATLGPWQYSLYVTFGRSPVQTTQYDGDGNVVRQIDANGDVTTSSYDPWQRQVATTNPVSGTSIMAYSATEQVATRDPQGNVTRDAYDGAGRLLQATDPGGGVTQYQYDPNGNTVSVTTSDADGTTRVETRRYDAQDEAISDTVSGPGTQPQTTLTAYDLAGNTIQTEQPDGDTVVDHYDLADEHTFEWVEQAATLAPTDPAYTSYAYDGAGNPTGSDDADGRSSTTAYDGDNRTMQTVAATSAPTGTTTLTTTLGYDPDSNVLARTTQTSDTTSPGIVQTHTYTATYNAADWQSSSADDGMVTQYGQDAAGRQRSETLQGGQGALTTVLDPRGRTTALAESIGGSGPYTSTFGYTADDRPYTISVPGGVQETAGYDVNDRLAHLGASGPTTGAVTTTLASGYDYAYNPNGWMTAVTSTLNTVVTSTQFTHNALGRLVQWSGQPNGPESWGYDGNGNIITNTEFLSGQYRTTVYTYSATIPNQEVQQHTDGFGVEYVQYDRNGDTTSITSTDPVTSLYHVDIHLSYDAAERPITVTTLQNMVPITVSLAYNAAGERSRYTVAMSGTTTLDEHFQYRDGELGQVSAMTATLDGQGQVTSSGSYTDTYVYGGLDEPLEFVRQQGGQTSRYFYVLDGQGNVVAVTDVSGHVVDRYAYDPWGEGLPEGTSETLPQPLRYRGYWWDGELGWYWLSTRSYDPEGRFLQPDPTALDGVLTYVYADDDPVDLMEAGGAFGLGDVFHAAVAFVESSAHVVYQISEAGWDLVAGDDVHLICCTDEPLYIKMLAGVDLALTILPGTDVASLLKVGAKVALKEGAERGAIKLVRWVIGHTVGRVNVDDETIARAIEERAAHGPGAVRAAERAVGCALCFPAGTRVATPHGEQAIQRLHVGDTVLAEDPKTGKPEAEAVQAVIQDPRSPLIAVDLSDGSAITVTADHPFWVDAGEGLAAPGWIAAGNLRPGDVLRAATGPGVVVEGLRRGVGRAVVYTLTVAHDHTFFVGQARVLVHNSGCFEISAEELGLAEANLRALKVTAEVVGDQVVVNFDVIATEEGYALTPS